MHFGGEMFSMKLNYVHVSYFEIKLYEFKINILLTVNLCYGTMLLKLNYTDIETD